MTSAQTQAHVEERLDRIQYRKRVWIGVGAAVVFAVVVLSVSVGFFVAGLRLRDERGQCISRGLSEFAVAVAHTLDKQIGVERRLPLQDVDAAARHLDRCGR